MGLLDNVTSAVNRGTAAAGRSAEKVKLKAQLADITKRRQGLAAQLGASLYEATKGDVALREGREALYAGIAACDTERAECLQQIEEIDQAAAADAEAAASYTCAVCGARMGGADLFCSGCGAPAEKARAAAPVAAEAPAGPVCAVCGAPLGEGDMFCMACGAKVEVSAGGAGVGEAEPAAPMTADGISAVERQGQSPCPTGDVPIPGAPDLAAGPSPVDGGEA